LGLFFAACPRPKGNLLSGSNKCGGKNGQFNRSDGRQSELTVNDRYFSLSDKN
jgi:hypothetical protein